MHSCAAHGHECPSARPTCVERMTCGVSGEAQARWGIKRPGKGRGASETARVCLGLALEVPAQGRHWAWVSLREALSKRVWRRVGPTRQSSDMAKHLRGAASSRTPPFNIGVDSLDHELGGVQESSSTVVEAGCFPAAERATWAWRGSATVSIPSWRLAQTTMPTATHAPTVQSAHFSTWCAHALVPALVCQAGHRLLKLGL